MICVVKTQTILIGVAFLFLAAYFTISNVFASSCSETSTTWTDSSLCGHGTMIAVIVTSHDPALEDKLAAYSAQSGLPDCTVENGCLEFATPYGTSNFNPASNAEMAPFVEQAHNTAPGAKILVVEAKSISWQDKWDAANYATTLPEVKRVSSVSYSIVVMIIGLILK